MGKELDIDDVVAGHPIAAAELLRLRGCLFWLLWGNQGSSSQVGLPIRRALGINRHANMTDEQIDAGQRFGVGA